MTMSPGQWERVKELYEAALRCSPEHCTAFLRQNEPDHAVRDEVRRLLARHPHLEGFLSDALFEHSPSSPSLGQRFEPGQILAQRFRVIAFVAAGGMGEVYKAEDTRLERTVALKFLSADLAQDRESLVRLHREAKAASALNHPNICTVHDFGEDEGRAFIAMEFLEGETLSARVKESKLSMDEVLKIATAVAGALSAAHCHGIIHRDLKPGNVMLTSTGPKLLDFGLARHQKPGPVDSETATCDTREHSIVGTLPYMSPEQLRAEEIDARGDIFSFGAVLYEMVAGKRAFERPSSTSTITAITQEEPEPLRELVKDVPEELERIIRRCLRKQRDHRYASMAEVEQELDKARLLFKPTAINLRGLLRQGKRPVVFVPVVLLLLAVVTGLAWWTHHSYKVRWAREQGLPQIADLIEKDKPGDAYSLALRVERYLPHDPILAKYWPKMSWLADIQTSPPGAAVFRRSYNTSSDSWEFIGRTPLKKMRSPNVDLSWKFQLPGYHTVERATFDPGPITVTLEEEGKAPPGMVHVELSPSPSQSHPVRLYGLPGFELLPPAPVKNYWIDQFEVSNEEYKRFIDQGGYQKPQYWKHEFFKDGHPLSWADAMKLFQDKTGMAGPSTWVQGEYPRGEADFPVSGVSWFEAAAYAEFAGKSLPTMYHWIGAASPWDGAALLPASNFGGVGTAARGANRGMSWSGAFDMAGNVKEWVANEAVPGKRYILGGAWNEPIYAFYDADARSPFERASNFGFRCANYVLTGPESKAAEPVIVTVRDARIEKPVSDQVFQAYKGLYSYDRTPLHSVVEYVHQADAWKVEKISFDAAYGGERVIAYLFLPNRASPPFQTVVYFPGAGAFHERSTPDLSSGYVETFDFIIKSGRAVLFPIYKGMFERWDDVIERPRNSSFFRDHVIAWSKDLARSIDYLETRPDIDRTRLAFEGYSMGAGFGALFPALENRFRALVLLSPGLFLNIRLPEADQLNFAPRVKTPALMLNGRYDFIFPTNSSQEPMYRLLGTPVEHKRRVVYETAHDVPRAEMIKESLNWLDHYLGPVQ